MTGCVRIVRLGIDFVIGGPIMSFGFYKKLVVLNCRCISAMHVRIYIPAIPVAMKLPTCS